jgi:uncharacterized protein DUF1254
MFASHRSVAFFIAIHADHRALVERLPPPTTMRDPSLKTFSPAAAALIFAAISMTSAADQTAKPKMATDIPPEITTPDSVDTRLGTLKFFDGFPDDATIQKVYDNLDFQRGIEVFLNTMPGASLYAMREGLHTVGVDNQAITLFESLMDSKTLFLTPNTETVYLVGWLDLKAGPIVGETPPNIPGFVDDFWFRYVIDMGNALLVSRAVRSADAFGIANRRAISQPW